jgi:hypothetical protein
MAVKKIIKLVLCISAQDGIISQVELDTSFKLINDLIEKIDRNSFNSVVKEFFDEENTLEEYIVSIPQNIDPNLVLKICHESALSDGLEIRENVAFDKACKFWGINPDIYS